MVKSVREADEFFSVAEVIFFLGRGKSFNILEGMPSVLPKANIFPRGEATRRSEILLFHLCNKA